MHRYCPACDTTTDGPFLPGPGRRPDASCPSCMSLERERFLALLLDAVSPALPRVDLLVDIAPSPRTSRLLDRLQPAQLIRMDLDPAADGRLVDVRASLTDLPLPDASVDVLFCYHVLEHIPDDGAAIAEIARVLAPGGVGILQVPWRASTPTDEDPSADTADRIRRFGQADHVRMYGSDFEDRLTQRGLDVRRVLVREFVGSDACAWMRLTPHEAVWLVRSPRRRGPGVLDTRSGLGSLQRAWSRALADQVAS